MTIAQIKTKLGVEQIDLVRGIQDDKPTQWLRSWDNTARIAIILHEDVLAAIKAGATNLAVKTENKASKETGEAYVQHTIITAASIEASI